jgi:hypothetical protein
MKNQLIQKILETRKITDYLTNKGIYPATPERGGKIKYKCPIHEKDNDPSFVVYTQSTEYQNFYCYGCKATFNIIHLFQKLENCSLEKAIKSLSEGLSVDIDSEISSAIRDFQQEDIDRKEYDVPQLVLLLNRQIYGLCKKVDNDSKIVSECENLFKKMDSIVEEYGDSSNSVMALRKMYDLILKQDIVKLKIKEYKKRKQT